MKILSTLIALTLALPALAQKPRTLTLTVDATDAGRRLLHARESIAAEPGPLTLRYPKWIPGEHGPTGPIIDVAALEMRAGGKPVAWTRDDVDLYAFHVTVPAGVKSLEVSFDYLGPGEREGYSSGGSMTPELLALEWNLIVLYPDASQRAITITPKLIVPRGWKAASALDVARTSGETIEYKPVTLETLVDSPVIAGAHFKSIPLGGTPDHFLDIVADSPQALEIEPATVDAWKKLVTQAGLLFGTRHYAKYHFLLVLSDKVAHFGLEHHQSSDNRSRERALVDTAARELMSGLLPHEFVHSWNGKFRRPAGLAVDGFDKPMKDDLLWVYEGLTNYLGFVLAGRAGLAKDAWIKDDLAATAASMEERAGRRWRPLEDTTMQAAMTERAQDWTIWRRSLDYYPEGTLVWLDADVLIRQKSGGKKSLDDFCRIFHGGANNGAEVKPYSINDVIQALDQVVPYNWAGFFQSRVYDVAPHAPLGGITNGGWKLVFTDKPNLRGQAIAKLDHAESYQFSLGFVLRNDERSGGAVLADVQPGSPAFKAGLGPSMRLLGVDGRRLGKESLEDAVKLHAATDKTPIELLVLNSDHYRILKIDYHGGLRNPHLERDAAKPDVLSEILKPLP